MKYINQEAVEKMQRTNLNLKSKFANNIYSMKQKGKGMTVIDRVHTYINKNEDALFAHQIQLMK